MRRLRIYRLVASAAALALLAACAGNGRPAVTTALDDGSITVASFNFPESEALAELYAQALEGRGFRVEREMNVGPRELVEPALQRGLVELVPEYAGSALGFFGVTASSEATTAHQQLVTALIPRGLAALIGAPAQDRNTFVVSSATAERLHVRSLSDLAPYAADMSFGGPAECSDRDLCLKGLEDVYGLRFKDFITLDAGGPLTVQALNDGTVAIGLLFTSDPAIQAGGLVELGDDRGLQPAENVTPVVSQATLARFGPTLVDTLNAVSALLRTSDLREMNAAMASGGAPSAVAHAWLESHGFAVPE
jgi:osmoprotectant transport system substrate-binding protein